MAERGLRDQADNYTAPFHRSQLNWVIGLPAVTLGLIAIDKHASGALSRNGSSASIDIFDMGLFGTAGAVGSYFWMEKPGAILMLSKLESWEPKLWLAAVWYMRHSN
jgi:hypothetical protein